MFVDGYDQGISQIIKNTGEHNKPVINLLLNYLDLEKDFIHIGTHLGIETLIIGR